MWLCQMFNLGLPFLLFFLSVPATTVKLRGAGPRHMSCTNPSAHHGEIIYKNCYKFTCINEFKRAIWKPNGPAIEKCCAHNGMLYEQGTMISSNLVCGSEEGRPFIQLVNSHNTAAQTCNTSAIETMLNKMGIKLDHINSSIESLSAGRDKTTPPPPTCPAPPTCEVCPTIPATSGPATGSAAAETDGLMISGGYFGIDAPTASVEIFNVKTRTTCTMVSILPTPIGWHTLDNVNSVPIACGGTAPAPSTTSASCIKLSSPNGTWTEHAKIFPRFEHSSWVFGIPGEQDLLLMNGRTSGQTNEYESLFNKKSEIVGVDGLNITFSSFLYRSCVISLEDSFLLTGGDYSSTYYSNVERYNIQGYVESLPSMFYPRSRHACGAYYQSNSQVLVAAGGSATDYESLDSAEVLLEGATSWVIVSPLPRKLSYMRNQMRNVGGRLYLVSGYDSTASTDSDKYNNEILMFNGYHWIQVGTISLGRSVSGVTAINNPEDYCIGSRRVKTFVVEDEAALEMQKIFMPSNDNDAGNKSDNE